MEPLWVILFQCVLIGMFALSASFKFLRTRSMVQHWSEYRYPSGDVRCCRSGVSGDCLYDISILDSREQDLRCFSICGSNGGSHSCPSHSSQA